MRLDPRLPDRGRGAPVRPGNDGRTILLILAAGAAILMIWGAVVWAVAAMSPPPPDPALANRSARALESPANWVTPDDYPVEARRRDEQGSVGVRFTVDARGHVATCDITTSSKSQLLDQTTCDLIVRRARYAPARDAQGRAIEDSKTLRFRWQLEE